MEPTAIPPNNSHQHLMNECDGLDALGSSTTAGRVRVTDGVTRSQWVTVAILCFVNLINYMDRYTIAGQFLFFSYQSHCDCVKVMSELEVVS